MADEYKLPPNLSLNNEIMTTKGPDEKQIVCIDCAHRFDSSLPEPGPTKASCEIYAYPDVKPSAVLFENSDCLYYTKEEPQE